MPENIRKVAEVPTAGIVIKVGTKVPIILPIVFEAFSIPTVLFGVQSILKKDNGLTGMYYDYAMAAPLMAGVTEKERSDILKCEEFYRRHLKRNRDVLKGVN